MESGYKGDSLRFCVIDLYLRKSRCKRRFLLIRLLVGIIFLGIFSLICLRGPKPRKTVYAGRFFDFAMCSDDTIVSWSA